MLLNSLMLRYANLLQDLVQQSKSLDPRKFHYPLKIMQKYIHIYLNSSKKLEQFIIITFSVTPPP